MIVKQMFKEYLREKTEIINRDYDAFIEKRNGLELKIKRETNKLNIARNSPFYLGLSQTITNISERIDGYHKELYELEKSDVLQFNNADELYNTALKALQLSLKESTKSSKEFPYDVSVDMNFVVQSKVYQIQQELNLLFTTPFYNLKDRYKNLFLRPIVKLVDFCEVQEEDGNIIYVNSLKYERDKKFEESGLCKVEINNKTYMMNLEEFYFLSDDLDK